MITLRDDHILVEIRSSICAVYALFISSALLLPTHLPPPEKSTVGVKLECGHVAISKVRYVPVAICFPYNDHRSISSHCNSGSNVRAI